MPPDVVCPHCHTADPGFDYTPVSGRGRVRSWTVVRQALLPGLDGDLPFVLVDVELAEHPDLRLIGRLFNGVGAKLQAGAGVIAVFEDLAEGVAVPGFQLS
jgi:uncharacterized OB-fold protein